MRTFFCVIVSQVFGVPDATDRQADRVVMKSLCWLVSWLLRNLSFDI